MHPETFAVLEYGGGKKVFVKTYDEGVSAHFRKGQQIHRASEASGEFVAPRPLFMVAERELILWEHLPGLVNLRKFLLETARARTGDEEERRATLFERCGKALAAIHSAVDPGHTAGETGFSARCAKAWSVLSDHVSAHLDRSKRSFLHGDYGCANAFVSVFADGDPRIVIIDASPNRFLYDSAGADVYGTIYLDLANFVASLNSRTAFYWRFRKRLPDWTKRFVTAYESAGGSALDMATVYATAAESLLRYRRYQIDRQSSATPRSRWEAAFRRWSARRLLRQALAELHAKGSG